MNTESAVPRHRLTVDEVGQLSGGLEESCANIAEVHMRTTTRTSVVVISFCLTR